MGLRKVLEDIYFMAYKDLLEPNHDVFRNALEIEKVMVRYSNRRASKCQLCNPYNPQHQEFPGWIGTLNYNKERKIKNKDIIIFGLEPTTEENTRNVLIKKYDFKRKYDLDFSFIHVWYELGYDTTDHDLIDNKRYGNRLFEYLSLFFHPLNKYIDRFYGTDLAKCYTKNLSQSRKICSKEYLRRELGCFANTGMIFILQGRVSKLLLEQFFKFTPDSNLFSYLKKCGEEIQELGITYNKRLKAYSFEIGFFSPKEKGKLNLSGKYLLIPHSSNNTRKYWTKFSNNQEEELVKELLIMIRNYLSLQK